jgi:hypothetical protein
MSLSKLETRVKKAEQQTHVRRKDLWIAFSFGPDDEPHGKYGYRRIQFGTGKKEAVEEEEEVKQLRDYYDKFLPKHAKMQHEGYSWATFEDYLKVHECKCLFHQGCARAKCEARSDGLTRLV